MQLERILLLWVYGKVQLDSQRPVLTSPSLRLEGKGEIACPFWRKHHIFSAFYPVHFLPSQPVPLASLNLITHWAPSWQWGSFQEPFKRVPGEYSWLRHLVPCEVSRNHTLWSLMECGSDPWVSGSLSPAACDLPPCWGLGCEGAAGLGKLSQREPWFTNCPDLTEATALLLIEHAAFPFYKNMKTAALRKMPGDFLSLGHVHHQAKIKSEVRSSLSLFLTKFSIWMWTWSLSLDLP